MESLFAYTDYRLYLKDYFQKNKQIDRGFSLRALAEAAGFRARDFLLRVMRGDRNLGPEGARMLSKSMGFKGKKSDYFLALVEFNQAECNADKERIYRRLSGIRKYGTVQKL